jgi:endonuclease YncB( thermonuclease family)
MMKKRIAAAAIGLMLASCAWEIGGAAAKVKRVFPGAYRAWVVKVTDSDTIRVVVDAWPGLQVPAAVRVFGVDTPEKFRPHCPYEKKLALKATAYVKGLVHPQDVVWLRDVQWGKYAGRVVAKVDITTENGSVELGQLLIARGYGRPYFGKTKSSWCDAGGNKETDK